MATPAQVEANRLNAQHSTGPRSDAGRARAARNAVRHGLFCRDVVLAGEDPAELEALRDGLLARLAPRDAVEGLIAEEIVAAAWKLRRLAAAERAMHDEQARDAHAEVVRRAEEAARRWDEHCAPYRFTRKAVQGPPPPPAPPFDPLATPAGASQAGLLRTAAYDRLDRLEERLRRSIHRALRELRVLRKEPPAPDGDEEGDVAAWTIARARADAPAPTEPAPVAASVQNEPNSDEMTVPGASLDASSRPCEVRHDPTSASSTAIVQNEPNLEPTVVDHASWPDLAAPISPLSAPPPGA